jgi:hypothetical protein
VALSAPQQIRLATIADAADLRLDPHHYLLYASVKEVVEGIQPAMTLAPPLVTSIQNGINLPQAAYAADEASDYLYASVGAFSQFVFQPGRSQPLKPPDTFRYPILLEQGVPQPDEVWVTRSGTPGIAWAAQWAPDPGPRIVPSGFLIRLRLDADLISPTYLAAILNHPIWRVWSASLAGGKRQRNLSQEHVAAIAVPVMSPSIQAKVGTLYTAALNEIELVLNSDVSIQGMCDDVLRTTGRLAFKSLDRHRLTFDEVPLAACVASPDLRLDARFHRGDIRASQELLNNTPTIQLRRLMNSNLIKGRQPVFLDEDASDGGAVVATSSIQGGQVQDDLLKLTAEETVIAAGMHKVHHGDLLLTMDGEGSIGKVAVYRRRDPAVTDSHIGIIRLLDPSHADALACFLNSSLGQAQIEMVISGSTGQTQLRRDDVHRLKVPRAILDSARVIGSQYMKGLGDYVPITTRVRRHICRAEAAISQCLLRADLDDKARAYMEAAADEDALMKLLGSLKPSMF